MEVIYILFRSQFSVVVGFFIVFLFIWFSFKTIQLQCFNNSNWIWIFTYFNNHSTNCRIFLCILYSTIITCLWTIYSGKQLGIYYIFIYLLCLLDYALKEIFRKNILIHFYKLKAYYIICEFGMLMIKSQNKQLPKNIFCNKLFIN